MFKQILTTSSKTAWVNTCEFVILHHTATRENTIKGVLNHLTTSGKASCHYVIDTNGDIYKIGEDTDILWHAWVSAWAWKTDINRFSIGIETIGPLKDGGFTDAQRKSIEDLVKYLAGKYAIPEQNILRHKDIAPKRKWDIADTFWNNKHASFDAYRKSLYNNTPIMASKYTGIMEKVIEETGFTPIFNEHAGETPLTEQETKELIEVALARFCERLCGKK